ncbi:hypothetical protein HDV00_006864 [Rhizophlyctis rosea]|nr:hypothetical protein HDV00_006864 [Rhizophlyctis rosea]
MTNHHHSLSPTTPDLYLRLDRLTRRALNKLPRLHTLANPTHLHLLTTPSQTRTAVTRVLAFFMFTRNEDLSLDEMRRFWGVLEGGEEAEGDGEGEEMGWEVLWEVRRVFPRGLHWRVGEGEKRFWLDRKVAERVMGFVVFQDCSFACCGVDCEESEVDGWEWVRGPVSVKEEEGVVDPNEGMPSSSFITPTPPATTPIPDFHNDSSFDTPLPTVDYAALFPNNHIIPNTHQLYPMTDNFFEDTPSSSSKEKTKRSHSSMTASNDFKSALSTDIEDEAQCADDPRIKRRRISPIENSNARLPTIPPTLATRRHRWRNAAAVWARRGTRGAAEVAKWAVWNAGLFAVGYTLLARGEN